MENQCKQCDNWRDYKSKYGDSSIDQINWDLMNGHGLDDHSKECDYQTRKNIIKIVEDWENDKIKKAIERILIDFVTDRVMHDSAYPRDSVEIKKWYENECYILFEKMKDTGCVYKDEDEDE